MRAVITRVKSASVSIAGSVVGEIGHGLLILLGVGPDDTPELCEKLADKALGLRIFCDEAGKMNRSLADIGDCCGGPPWFLRQQEPDGGTLERNVGEAYDNTTEAGSSVSAYTDSGALGVPYAFAR